MSGWAIRGPGSCQLQPRSLREHWETLPLPRKACFLPVTQPWPGNLRRTACDCLLLGPMQGTHWLSCPGQRPAPQPWPDLGFGCLGRGSQRRRSRLKLGCGGGGSCPPPQSSQSLLLRHRSKINYYFFVNSLFLHTLVFACPLPPSVVRIKLSFLLLPRPIVHDGRPAWTAPAWGGTGIFTVATEG